MGGVGSPVGIGPKTPVKNTAKRPPKHSGAYETNLDKLKKTHKNSKSPITSAVKGQRRSSMTNGGHKGSH